MVRVFKGRRQGEVSPLHQHTILDYLRTQLDVIQQHFSEDDREASTLIGRLNYLAHHIPNAPNLFLIFGKCYERLNQSIQAFRCFSIHAHLQPESIVGIQSLQNVLIEGLQTGRINLEENVSLKELQFRQLMVNPLDFEVRLFFMRKLIDVNLKRPKSKRKNDQIYLFILDYFKRKYISKIVNIKTDHSLLTSEQIQEFKTVIEIFQTSDMENEAIEMNKLVIKLAPTSDPQLYLSLFDLYNKTHDYLNAFKAYSHFMYLTGNSSLDSYLVCAECLEKAGQYGLSLLAYWQCHTLQQQELMSYRQQEAREQVDEEQNVPKQEQQQQEVIAQYDDKSLKYLLHIQSSIIPKLQSKKVILNQEQQKLVEEIGRIKQDTFNK